MKPLAIAIAACASVIAFTAAPAQANMCRAETLTCPTTMPVDGYCECHAHGTTQGGTVIAARDAHAHVDATTGGCGNDPHSPGCR
jgi:hypothetical protein